MPVMARLNWEMTRAAASSAPVKLVRQAVEQNRVETRVTEEDLDDAPGGRVLAKDGVDLFPDGSKHPASIMTQGRACPARCVIY